MKNGQQEIITAKTFEDKHYGMRQFSNLCRNNLLICCKKCNNIITTNSIIEKLLRLKTGKICFIIGDDDEKSELMEQFKSSILLNGELKVNINSDLNTVGIYEIYCKNCKNPLGANVKQTDDTQIFMLNKYVLKHDSINFYLIEELGLEPYYFHFRNETIKKMDKEAMEIEEYIYQSGQQLQKFFELLSGQTKDIREIETRKTDLDKLGDILKYLIDKNFI